MINVVRDIIGYVASSDYARLLELAKNQSVVCIVDCYECRDVCQTIWPEDTPFPNVSARGIIYVSAHSNESFIDQCEKINLCWLVPAVILATRDEATSPPT